METKLLLINLPCYLSMKDFVENSYSYNPSLGLLAIAEYVSMFGFSAKVIDYNYAELDYYSLEEFICKEGISVVGVTAYTENLNLLFKFAKVLKDINRNLTIVVGGPHATLKPNEVIKNRYVDYVTVHDGEASMLELLLHFEYGDSFIKIDQIGGISTRKNVLMQRGNVSDLSLLPIINRLKAQPERYNMVVTLYSSKGCPAKCIYCAASFISGSKYRIRNAYSRLPRELGLE